MKLKLIFALLCLNLFAHAQAYKAGNILSGYVDISPDTLIGYVWVHGATSTENYFFDINSDGQNDFEIKSFSTNYNGGGTDYINILPLNSRSFSLYSRTDSVSYFITSTSWISCNVAKPLMTGDTINSLRANWRSTALSITNNSWYAGANLNVTDWIGSNDLFIGLKYQSPADTVFAWVKVNCPDKEHCYIKEYSSTHTFTGIKDQEWAMLALFPNPASRTIYISDEHRFENAEVEILNYSGQLVLKQALSNSIDVSQLSKGLYLLQINSKNKRYYSKFIKE